MLWKLTYHTIGKSRWNFKFLNMHNQPKLYQVYWQIKLIYNKQWWEDKNSFPRKKNSRPHELSAKISVKIFISNIHKVGRELEEHNQTPCMKLALNWHQSLLKKKNYKVFSLINVVQISSIKYLQIKFKNTLGRSHTVTKLVSFQRCWEGST